MFCMREAIKAGRVYDFTLRALRLYCIDYLQEMRLRDSEEIRFKHPIDTLLKARDRIQSRDIDYSDLA